MSRATPGKPYPIARNGHNETVAHGEVSMMGELPFHPIPSIDQHLEPALGPVSLGQLGRNLLEVCIVRAAGQENEAVESFPR